MDSKVATKVVAPPILKGGGEKEPRDSPLGGTGTLGSPPIKNPPRAMNPEEKGGDQNPEVHPDTIVKISRVASMERLSWEGGGRFV